MVNKCSTQLIFILALAIFPSCNSKYPTDGNIIGIWHAKDGAEIEFSKDGSFYSKNLPVDLFLPFSKDYQNRLFNASGNWKLVKDQGSWIVLLDFKEQQCRSYILISGSGIFENRPPWYLFVWEEEEGGDRFKFVNNL
jgi:hypothetical protein